MTITTVISIDGKDVEVEVDGSATLCGPYGEIDDIIVDSVVRTDTGDVLEYECDGPWARYIDDALADAEHQRRVAEDSAPRSYGDDGIDFADPGGTSALRAADAEQSTQSSLSVMRRI